MTSKPRPNVGYGQYPEENKPVNRERGKFEVGSSNRPTYELDPEVIKEMEEEEERENQLRGYIDYDDDPDESE